MNFFKPKESPKPAAGTMTPQSPSQFLQQAATTVQAHFSNFFSGFQRNPPLRSLFFARTSNENSIIQVNSSGSTSSSVKNYAMTSEAIEERLAGVPVYALTNGSQEFVLVSGTNTGKSLGLFCFSEADAGTLLKQMKSVDPSMSSGSQIVPVALSKVFQLQVDGVALRLLPEPSQIQNAMKERKRAGISEEGFRGVPVFQEDLEKSLSRASRDQKQLNPALRGDIQVAVLEDIVQGMKDSSSSVWGDVFIPPGFDVSTSPNQR